PARARTTTVARLKSIEAGRPEGRGPPSPRARPTRCSPSCAHVRYCARRRKRTLRAAGDLHDSVRPVDALDGVEELVSQRVPAQVSEAHLVLAPRPLHDAARTTQVIRGHDDGRRVVWPSTARRQLLVTH